MKKNNLCLLVATFMSMICVNVLAHDIEMENDDNVMIYYNFINDGQELSVTFMGVDLYSAQYTGSVVIPEEVDYDGTIYSVTNIGERAFNRCSGLTSISIPNSVTSISERAFSGCSGLTSINIPNSVTSIEMGTFAGCSSLTSFIIPNSVTSIGSSAFHSCIGLTSIVIPNSVTSIGGDAFYGCSSLTSINIPNSVISFETSALTGCCGLSSIVVEESNPVYDSRDNCNAIIEKSTNTLKQGCQTTVIPNSVTTIGSGAFYGCSELTSIIIPNSVTSIEGYAFYNCSGLTSVTIPNSVKKIGSMVFAGCNNLTSPLYNEVQFVFLPLSYHGEYNIPDGITTISGGAFYHCVDLTSVTIPNSVTSIGERAFYGCKSLASIDIPNNVKSIGSSAFYGCSGLTSMTIPNSVTSIDFQTFYGCSSLTSVIIPKSVKSIIDAFEMCDKLTDFYCYSENIPTEDDNEFSGVPLENATLHVPASLMGSYKNKIPWSDFGQIVALPQITYMINGQTYKTSVIPVGEAVIAETEPEKEGCTFSGWSEIPSTMPNEDVTVTGTFTPNKYKLIYMVDDEEYKIVEVEYGTNIEAEGEPTKEGYTFSGWKNLPIKMPADDVTVTGSFTINQYKLTYKVDDDEYKSFDVEYDSAITPEAAPTKEGYTFSGWCEIPAKMPAGDVTITGSFIPKKYMLTYIVDGETYKTFEIDCGAILSIEPEPIKEGCLFSGWSEIPKTMPARNLSIMGTFTISDDIQGVNADEGEYQIYTLEGKQVENLQKGVNIIRYSDGTSKKIYVK